MTEKFVDDVSYDEAYDDYLAKHYPLEAGFKEYNCLPEYADTLDEYLMLLIKGFINAQIRTHLEKHVMELFEDEWFHQWPLVRWDYASRLLHGTGYRKNVKQAIELLLPLSEEGCPGALYDIGYCYMNGLKFKRSYAKAFHYWIQASRKGYHIAQEELRNDYLSRANGYYNNFPIELKLDFAFEIQRLHSEGNLYKKFGEKQKKEYDKFCKETKKLEKQVLEKTRLRETASLFWSDEENPYKINF